MSNFIKHQIMEEIFHTSDYKDMDYSIEIPETYTPDSNVLNRDFTNNAAPPPPPLQETSKEK